MPMAGHDVGCDESSNHAMALMTGDAVGYGRKKGGGRGPGVCRRKKR